MKAYVKWSVVIFLISILGWILLIFFVPDRLGGFWDRTLWLIGCILTLPTWPLFFVYDPKEVPEGLLWVMAYTSVAAVVWPLLILAVRYLCKKIAEQGAARNSRPTRQSSGI
jgi:hypothetical protein